MSVRRFFIAAEGKGKDGAHKRPDDGERIYVDDEGTCHRHHDQGMHRLWHVYTDISDAGRQERRHAVRCPSSLMPEERADLMERFPASR